MASPPLGAPLAGRFDLTAQKSPQLVTAALGMTRANELPALAALRNLVQLCEGKVEIELEDGRHVFAPAGAIWLR
jgi:hypothetical protein